MATDHLRSLLFFFMILASIHTTTPLQSSQAWSLLRLQHLLHYPQALSSWSNNTDLCSSEPSPSLSIVCYEQSITQLHISGPPLSPPLPLDFSIDSVFTTLTRLPDLKVLTLSSLGIWGPLPKKIWRLSKLEILDLSSNRLSGPLPLELSFLKGLQSLILDRNQLSGPVPDWLSAFPLLAVLSLNENSLCGTIPDSVQSLENLRVLRISANNLTGDVPDLSGLSNLQVLDLEDNRLGPLFPAMQRKVVTVLLKNNRFTGSLPPEIGSYYLLQRLDVSGNLFVGPLPSTLLNLPSLHHLNISGNRFTGLLMRNSSCSDALEAVDLSSNLLTGILPDCLAARNAGYVMNCLATGRRDQHPLSFCQTEALAVGVLPPNQKGMSMSKPALVTTILGAIVVGVALVGVLMFFVARRRTSVRRALSKPPRRVIEHASNRYQSKILSGAMHISQTMKLGALDIPPYRSFSLEELETATNNFDSSLFMGEGCHGEMYKGKLEDGTMVAIRCLKLKKNQSSQSFTRHIELITKLRHHHLVSSLGHCFEYYTDGSTVSRLFLIFEYVSNGTLRDHVREGIAGEKLTWMQRISAAIGVAKGLQFLHAGIIPGLFGNKLKTTNVLLDQNLVAKISSYSLPVLGDDMRIELIGGSSSNGSKDFKDKEKLDEKIIDIYDFGIILLELISGKPVTSKTEVETAIHKLQAVTAADGVARRRSVVDPVVSQVSSTESLRTVTELCLRCLSKELTDRPSVEDVLWNLQFAVQVQDSWRGDSQSSEGSISPSQYPPQSVVSIY